MLKLQADLADREQCRVTWANIELRPGPIDGVAPHGIIHLHRYMFCIGA